jgi:hypothetical protein
MEFLKTTLACILGQIIVWIIVQGFKKSYWCKNAIEEITRIWNSFSKHMRKQKNNGQ